MILLSWPDLPGLKSIYYIWVAGIDLAALADKLVFCGYAKTCAFTEFLCTEYEDDKFWGTVTNSNTSVFSATDSIYHWTSSWKEFEMLCFEIGAEMHEIPET